MGSLLSQPSPRMFISGVKAETGVSNQLQVQTSFMSCAVFQHAGSPNSQKSIVESNLSFWLVICKLQLNIFEKCVFSS